jgi:signal transduction histidine kinase
MGSNRRLFWIRLLGTLLCLLLGVSNAIESRYLPTPRSAFQIAVALLLHLLFAYLFRLVTRDFPAAQPWHARVLAVQLVLGGILNSDLSVINALTIPLVLPRTRWFRWLGALVLSFAVAAGLMLYELREEVRKALAQDPNQAFVLVAGLGQSIMWILVAFYAARLISQMEEDRRRLGALNAELLSSRQLVAESSRYTERLRIARELHDSLGHHLTTLNLNLELCRHLPAPEKDVHVEKAQFLAKLLLADLRDVVSSWRNDEPMALAQALQELRHGVTGLDIEFSIEVDPNLAVTDSGLSHTILRCAQEAVTNVLRHASATRIAISLQRKDTALALTVNDNGRGCETIIEGNGLAGIEGRVAEYNGKCWVESAGEGKGFTVRVEIPFPEAMA